MTCRESELVGNVRRDIKEAVAATVSKINKCPYCVDAHTIMLNAAGKYNDAREITNERYNKISDPQVRSIVDCARAS